MATSKVRLLLFGDQTENPFQHISDLSRDAKNSSLIENFLRSSSAALTKEINMINAVEREQFPRFSTIIELAKAHQQQDSYDPVISGVLMCLTQLGCFIGYAETTPHAYLSLDNTYIGLSTGLISAAAIACSKSLSQLVEVAVEIVCICFRAGLVAKRRAHQLEREVDAKNSWAILVENISSNEAKSLMEEIDHRRSIVPSKQAYISAESNSSVTISGPPSTLKLLFSKSEIFASYKHTHLCIGGIYHANHLGSVDPLSIIGDRLHFGTYSINGRVHSTRDGKCFLGTNLRDLLVEVINDLLLEPLRWNQVISELIGGLTCIRCTEIDILPFGPNNVCKDLVNSLGEAGISAHIKSTGGSRSIFASDCRKGAIAIVGMSGRFPGGESLEEFWKTLMDGCDVHREVPSDRFDVKTHYDPTGTIRNSTLTPYGCFLDRPGYFDATLFNMTPREATQTDPQHRLALMTTYEALEMSGYAPNRTPSTANHRIATFFGQTSDDWREVNTSQDIDTYYITGGIRAFAPGRLNYYFKWEGPSYSIDTACSSSSASMQLAYSALVNHECDTAIAGGLSLLTAPDPFAGLSRSGFLSKSGSCKTFDEDADGYCRGDGVACIVMKRLEDAIADNDTIQAVLLGAVTNHSAEAISITHPHAPTQERLFRKLLNHTVLRPNDIDYVELHGTGTQSGDAIETRAVTAVFAKCRPPEIPLYIGSVKANLGHGEGVSGVTGMIKSILMLQNSMIPPHVGIKTRLNRKLPPFDALNVRIAMRPTEFKPRAVNSKRRIVLNNFNAAGGNTSLLIEDPPLRVIEGIDPRSVHVVTVSAKSPFSFKANAERLLTYIRKHPHSSLGDISYTTTARRMHHLYRTALTVSTIADLESSLEKIIISTTDPIKSSSPNVAFVFTGQGSHYLKMGKELFDHCSTFREDILEYDKICQRQDLPSFKSLIDGSIESVEMVSPVQVELALISLELALSNLCLTFGIKPTVVIGHSHGEYAALCVAGVLSVNDTIYLVGKRATLLTSMCNRGSHSMVAIMLDAESVKKDLIENVSQCEIACYNSPQSTVISGPAQEIVSLISYYKSKEIKTVQLQIPFAFHSSQLEIIMKDYRIVTEGVAFGKPIIPVGSTLLGRVVKEKGVFTAEHLCRHARESVKFLDTIEECKSTGIVDDRTIWIEIGPSPVCLNMVKSILKVPPNLSVYTLKKGESSLAAIATCISKVYAAGVDVHWMAYHREYESKHRLLPLPTYAFDLKNYWIQYQGDWCLRKNLGSSSQLIQPPVSSFVGTTTLQRIQTEIFDSSGADVLFVSDFTEPKLRDTVLQHRVNGIGLCPCSVFADMAFTAAKYIHKHGDQSTPTPSMDLINMEALETFTEQNCIDRSIMYISAIRQTDSNTVQLTFHSGETTTKKIYATCIVQYGDDVEWITEWKKYAFLIQSRMDQIVKGAEFGNSHRLRKEMVYKLCSTLVRYSDKYRGIEEIWMDIKTLEATANIQFPITINDGSFEYNPYTIDTIVHLTGCIITSADIAQPGYIYTSNSWKSLRIVGHLSTDKVYRSYVHMQSINDNNVLSGDVYLFDGNNVVSVCSGVKFNPVHCSVLDYLLPSTNHKSAVDNPSILTVNSDSFLFDNILEMISSETKVEKTELGDEINLIDLGVDSLLTISILARLHQLTNVNVPTSLFQTHPTVGDLRKFYSVNRSMETTKKIEIGPTACTSIFLQGSSTSLPPLFLLPDGSGSASSYVPLPVFDNSMIIYGLNSPFLDCSSEFTCNVEEMGEIYLTEIRKRQSSGPYILGGWSAGGILAYEVATQLIAAGEKVLGLIFIDSPCPVTLPPYPFEYIEFLDSIGIFDNIHHGSKNIPVAIKAHFKSCLTNVMRYTAKPIDPLRAPKKAVVIWAKEGVLSSISDEHSEISKGEGTNNLKDWLLESRKDYGPGGWENLLPNVECVIIPGNHFTIMRQPHVINLAKQIERAVVKIMNTN